MSGRSPYKVRKEIQIQAPLSSVWDTLTDAEQVGEMMFGCKVDCDWSPGSEIRFSGEFQGVKFMDRGIIITCSIEQELAYTYLSSFSGLEDKPENYSIVRYRLSGMDDGSTTLTLTQENMPSAEAVRHAESGWDHALGQLKAMVESA